MSASSKKKLRKEQEEKLLTEKQLQEKKEARNLKIASTAFIVVMVLVVGFFLISSVLNWWNSNGFTDRLSTSLKVNNEKVSVAEMNYYYMDTISQYYNTYYEYAGSNAGAMLLASGLDVAKPLNQQLMPGNDTVTWADYFANMAAEKATEVIVLVDAAKKAGFTLGESEKTAIENQLAQTEAYVTLMYGYPDLETYLKDTYGNGSTLKSYRTYLEENSLATAFFNAYPETLSYTDEQYENYSVKNFDTYCDYSYSYYRMNVSSFYTGGTKDEETGTTTYSDEEKAAGLKAAEEAAKEIEASGANNTALLNAAIDKISVFTGKKVIATEYTDKAYSEIPSEDMQKWMCEEGRKEGDLGVLPIKGSDDVITGYYLVIYNGRNENNFNLVNVRHILVEFSETTTDSTTGSTVPTTEADAAAKAEAEDILAKFEATGKTAEDFAALVKDNSDDDGSVNNGGLYEEVYPGWSVEEFNDWCFAEGRKAGDYGVIKTQFGYHVMFFDGYADVTFRRYMIDNDMRYEDQQAWLKGLIESAKVGKLDISKLDLDYVMSPAS